ncbi:ABC-2 type transport system permease protein [Nocardiopsis mwathae]|uniref:Transport permease protein n=1 Tax=Nocardiopsis mwathae TaxID=1472723 RepID=A0A7W9YMJ0_9ACTN|nr:ABC transporter permease [Nocardiopsis mwathae]MBB6174908.1 ABC-2 type transport system permease protein [Nocardiopsis mwathae]
MSNRSTLQESKARPDPVRQALARRGENLRRPGPLSASVTFGWRALLKIKYNTDQLHDAFLIPVLFTVMFTLVFGGALAGTTGEYLEYLLPGIWTFVILTMTLYTGSAVSADMAKGIFDRFRTLRIWRPAVIVGALIGDVVRYTIGSVMVVLVGLVMGLRPSGGLIGVLLSALLILLFAFSVSWIWTAVGVLVRSPDTVSSVGMPVLYAMVGLSNVFVDPETMPSWLRAIVGINPVTHLVDAVRALLNGEVAVAQVGWVLLGCGVMIAVFGPITMYAYRRR